MAHNRFFIVNDDDDNIDDIINVSIGDLQEQRCSLDKTLIVIKLHEGDTNNYDFLSNYTEYDEEEILEALNNDTWRVLI